MATRSFPGKNTVCDDCSRGVVNRRDFLRAAGVGAAALALPTWGRGAEGVTVPMAETKVKELYDSLSTDQRKALCFAFDHNLRKKVSANWEITEPSIEDLSKVQQEMVTSIVKGLTSEEGFQKFSKQMEDDAGGLGQYHIAIFGEPGLSKFEFVLTGRHVTMRADGNSIDKVSFGGPMVYGHAAEADDEPADHKGNVFWYQGVRANEVFGALNPDQRKKALVQKAPGEAKIEHRPTGYDGISVGEMTSDQKQLVNKVMTDLLAPYRTEDVEEVMRTITANGGLDKIHLAFYQLDAGGKNADIGNDGVWDIWRLEGPGLVWHFRGAPHVHTWVNIADVS